MYRGHLGRLEYRAVVHEAYRRECTVRVQQAYRCHVARVLYADLWQQAHEDNAALDIQRVQRGHVARQTVRDFLNAKALEKANAMAKNIQRVYRGHVARVAARRAHGGACCSGCGIALKTGSACLTVRTILFASSSASLALQWTWRATSSIGNL